MTEVKTVGQAMGNVISSMSEDIELKEFTCNIHGTYKGYISRMMLFGKERVFDPPCPECEAEKEKQNAASEALLEESRKREIKERQEALFEEMNIGEKFWNESFETFNAYTDELKKHLNTCIEFTENHHGRMLVMLGNNGNGKDHLASSILKKIGGYMYSVFEIELMLKQSYSGNINEWDIYEKLCKKAPLLVINEIGKHKPGDWEMNFLSYIINKRYENMKPIILVSNAHLKGSCPKGGCDDCLQNYIGEDVVSRISEGGEIMLFTGKDYRLKKRNERFSPEGKNSSC